jgi:hypothetical protein
VIKWKRLFCRKKLQYSSKVMKNWKYFINTLKTYLKKWRKRLPLRQLIKN